MKRALVVCLLLACKREEDAPQQVVTTTTATSSSASAVTGPTPLVALAQPSDSTASSTTSPTPTLAPTSTQSTTPTSTSSAQTQPARVASVVVGAVSANGLPAESVKRVVAQNTARYRQCYEAGLRGNPALRGRVVVRMTIDASGAMASAEDGGSDIPDANVVNCVFGTMGTLTFPQPEAGSATATVPIVFSPP